MSPPEQLSPTASGLRVRAPSIGALVGVVVLVAAYARPVGRESVQVVTGRIAASVSLGVFGRVKVCREKDGKVGLRFFASPAPGVRVVQVLVGC